MTQIEKNEKVAFCCFHLSCTFLQFLIVYHLFEHQMSRTTEYTMVLPVTENTGGDGGS